MQVIGIDPGLTGAICIYDGKELILWDMPVMETTVNGKKRNKININKLLLIIKESKKYAHIEKYECYIEQVRAQPGNGVSAAFTYGFGCGVIETAIIASGIPLTYVSPQKWKKTLNCPKDKNESRARASQLLPDYAHCWDRKSDHGKAEAALIAYYGYQNHKIR